MQIGNSTLPERASDASIGDAAPNVAGAGFDRLVAAAQAEAERRQSIAARSGANADTFTDQSWLQTMKAHGSEIGLAAYAHAIRSDSRGQMIVSDAGMRQRILTYRTDPTIRAVMAVKRAGDVRATLAAELGRSPSDIETRAADVLGAKSAAKLILARQSTPLSSAAIAAPEAAEASHGLFYRPDGSPLTVNEVLLRVMAPEQGQTVTQGPATPATPMMVPTLGTAMVPGMTQSLPPDVMRALQARASFASPATAAHPVGTQVRRAASPPPDLALVSGTIGNLSMPGTTKGPLAATGGHLNGWRGQMAAEVTSQVTHPERVVQKLPSNVTIPAPQMTRYAPANEVHRPPVVPVVAPAAQPVASNLLGPQLGVAPVAVAPQSAPLPNLIVDGENRPPAALPEAALALLPIGQQPPGVPATGVPQFSQAPQVSGPQQGQPQYSVQAVPQAPLAGEATIPGQQAPAAVEAAPERPSRYGPRASQVYERPARALGYASAVDVQPQVDSSSAGIHPSRYFQSASLAAQQYAAMSRMAATNSQAVGPTQSMPAAPVMLGPDGNPVLPPVPPLSGLPPLTASEALQPGQLDVASSQAGPIPPRPIGNPDAQRLAALDGTKPLDLAPDATSYEPALAAASAPLGVTTHPANRSRPRTTPPFMFGR